MMSLVWQAAGWLVDEDCGEFSTFVPTGDWEFVYHVPWASCWRYVWPLAVQHPAPIPWSHLDAYE